jgi:endo-1,4-beta-xylanase
MTRRAFFRPGLMAVILFTLGCTPAVFTPPDIGSTPLQDKYASYFTVGAATTPSKLAAVQNIVDFHFNRLTCENDMKWGAIHPDGNTWSFTNADALANYARNRGIKMTGHTLIWHNQLPSNNWIFNGLTPNTDEARSALKTIMQNHIDTLVERYYDVIDNWDVVNEAIADDGTYRSASPWYQYFGSEEYIYWAFRYTKEALESHAGGTGSSAGKLYYNDYSLENTTKLNKVLAMADWLKGNGAALPGYPITIDGIGNQAHWKLSSTSPSPAGIQAFIVAVAAAGYKVKFSELDVSIYSGTEAQKEFTPALAQQQADRYDAIFGLFRANAASITSVTFWGVSDDQSWLNNFPVANRDDYPLLFDRGHNAKPAYDAIVDF